MDDPELLPYRSLYGAKTSIHPTGGPCFICEGRFLVESALEAGRAGELKVLSLLCEERLEGDFQALLPPGAHLLTAEKQALSELVGFEFHRGVLCCVAQPPEPTESALMAMGRLLVIPHVDNAENLGLLLRSAAALGIEGIVTGRGPSPFERRALRVSMGAAWKLPIHRREDPLTLLKAWRDQAPGSELVAAALSPSAQDARRWEPAPRCALVLGPEAYGLEETWLQACDRTVAIPMAHGMDSLNVAAAGAILMFRMLA
nr:RNA methyltransferase [uncultured Holophaga sp.]